MEPAVVQAFAVAEAHAAARRAAELLARAGVARGPDFAVQQPDRVGSSKRLSGARPIAIPWCCALQWRSRAGQPLLLRVSYELDLNLNHQ